MVLEQFYIGSDWLGGGFMINLANLLTISRLVFMPIYIYLFLTGDYLLSGIIFTISVSTDLMDGYVARTFNMETQLGKLLDPLADKLTVISILSLLIYFDFIPQAIAIILLSREIIIFSCSLLAYFMGKNLINPTKLGKISIAVLYVGLAARLFGFNIISNIFLYSAIPLNITSAIDYFIVAFKK